MHVTFIWPIFLSIIFIIIIYFFFKIYLLILLLLLLLLDLLSLLLLCSMLILGQYIIFSQGIVLLCILSFPIFEWIIIMKLYEKFEKLRKIIFTMKSQRKMICYYLNSYFFLDLWHYYLEPITSPLRWNCCFRIYSIFLF